MAKVNVVLVLVGLVAVQIATVHSVATPPELKKFTASIRQKCLAENGIEESVVDDTEIGEFPQDRNLACYLACTLKKFNMMSKEGKLNISLMRRIIPDSFKELGNQMLDACENVEGEDECWLAFNFNKCLYDSNPVAYFVV